MSLATRCTACGTVFRVVQDQLKVSEGWVRCGRCEQVFNALEGLFDLTREPLPASAISPPPSPPATEPTTDAAPVAEAGPSVDEVDEGPLDPPLDLHADPLSTRQREGEAEAPPRDPDLVHRIDAHLFRRRTESNTTPAALVDKRDRHEFSDARFDTNLFVDEEELPPETAAVPAPAEEEDPDGFASASQLEPMPPEFVRQAQRRAFWAQPKVKRAVGAAVVALAGLLLVQVVVHDHDLSAARWPVLRPMIASWCELRGCTVGTPHRIDDLVVDSTALTQRSGDALLLAVTLRNRGNIDVATPSIELALTDGAGQLAARRVLSPRDFPNAAPAVPAQGEIALQVPISVGGQRISGYTVEAFYP